jgi:F-box-like
MTNHHSNINLPPPTPWLLTLPNEILLHIFSLLPYWFFIDYVSDGKQYRQVSPILVLRSVCRHFRALTPQMDFWYKPDFSFSQLIPSFYTRRWGPRALEQPLLRVLFNDANVVNALGPNGSLQ